MILLKILHMKNLLRKLILLIQTKKILKKETEDVDKKILNPSKCIVTQDINRLTKININLRIAEA